MFFTADFTNNVLNFNSGTVSFAGVTTQRTYTLAGNAANDTLDADLGPNQRSVVREVD